jgi:hypothetical protein
MVLATNRLDDGFSASPVPVGNRLLLRGHSFLYCIEEKKTEDPIRTDGASPTSNGARRGQKTE